MATPLPESEGTEGRVNIRTDPTLGARVSALVIAAKLLESRNGLTLKPAEVSDLLRVAEWILEPDLDAAAMMAEKGMYRMSAAMNEEFHDALRRHRGEEFHNAIRHMIEGESEVPPEEQIDLDEVDHQK